MGESMLHVIREGCIPTNIITGVKRIDLHTSRGNSVHHDGWLMGVEEVKVKITKRLLFAVKTVFAVVGERLIEEIKIEITGAERVACRQCAVAAIEHGRRIRDGHGGLLLLLHSVVGRLVLLLLLLLRRLLLLLLLLMWIRSVTGRHRVPLIRMAGTHSRLLLLRERLLLLLYPHH